MIQVWLYTIWQPSLVIPLLIYLSDRTVSLPLGDTFVDNISDFAQDKLLGPQRHTSFFHEILLPGSIFPLLRGSVGNIPNRFHLVVAGNCFCLAVGGILAP